MATAHEIFQRPFPVKLEWESVPTPKHYRSYPDAKDLPETMQVWNVQRPSTERSRGLVSDGFGFTDSPDCEFIAGGLSSKNRTAVALGRQANWFLWGFSAPPSEMTESARAVFLNTVVYMKRFDGAKLLVADPVEAREWAETFASWYTRDQGFDVVSHSKRCFTPRLLEASGGDLKRLLEFVLANRGCLRVDTGTDRFDIDPDVKSLGLANNDVALIERCVTMLEKGDRADLARTLLARYVDASPGPDAKSWRAWLDANRAKLYFTDRGGYRFRVRS